jgi:hypothetical protein
VAALGPAILAIGGSTRTGALVIDAVDPEAHIVVEVGEQVVIHEGAAPPGAVALAGRSVDLVEALSFRAPLRADIGAEHRWLLGALDEVFEVSERY